MENIADLVLLGGLITAAGFFFISLTFGIKNDIKWMKFFAFGLVTLAFSGTMLGTLWTLTYDEFVDLELAIVLFVIFAFIFYFSYRLAEPHE